MDKVIEIKVQGLIDSADLMIDAIVRNVVINKYELDCADNLMMKGCAITYLEIAGLDAYKAYEEKLQAKFGEIVDRVEAEYKEMYEGKDVMYRHNGKLRKVTVNKVEIFRSSLLRYEPARLWISIRKTGIITVPENVMLADVYEAANQ